MLTLVPENAVPQIQEMLKIAAGFSELYNARYGHSEDNIMQKAMF